MGDYGVWTILPPVIVIYFALRTKRPVESLLLGCVSSYVVISIKDHIEFLPLLNDAFFKVVTDQSNLWLIMVCALFGSLIALLNRSGGTMAIGNFLNKICKSKRSVLLSVWVMGILIFIDDYMNIMTINSCMKSLCDKKKIPRATLAYVVDSTGAPVCVLVPFSTWAIFYAANFYEQPAVKALGFSSAMSTYVHAVPFMFYGYLSLIILLLFICGVIPVIGPLKQEYEKIEKQDNAEVNTTSTATGKLIDFVLPLGVMIAFTVILDDMLVALILSILTCFILYVPRRIVSIRECCDLWIKGIADMVPTLLLLLGAFFMKQACADINLPSYVVNNCAPYFRAATFPAFTFVLVSILAFITGDSWGIPAICIPIIIPLASICGANMLLTMGATVSGGVFCSHACFYSDATVLTAVSCDIDPMLHAKTQLPYAMIGFAVSFVIYLILGII